MTDNERTTGARSLRDAYVRVVNAALQDGRDDLARELAQEYARALTPTGPAHS